MEQTWSAEPWHACTASNGECWCQGIHGNDGEAIARFYGSDTGGIEGLVISCPSVAEGHANRFRAEACVNAMASIPDPAAFVREARELARWADQHFVRVQHGNPEQMLDDEHALWGKARAFLAKHGGQI